MIIATLVFFVLPSVLLGIAWRGHLKDQAAGTISRNWRAHCTKAGLVAAGCATLLELAFMISWFHNDGSPHGMMPSPGLWKTIGTIPVWACATSIVLCAFGKGKYRLLILDWALMLPLV